MTQSMENDFQRLVIERLDKIDSDIAGLKQDTKDTNTKFDIYVKASEKSSDWPPPSSLLLAPLPC